MTKGSLDYVRAYYGVPAFKGRRVEVKEGVQGIITGGSGPHVLVRIDGEKKAFPYHPQSIKYIEGWPPR